jgi:hypothetical protein
LSAEQATMQGRPRLRCDSIHAEMASIHGARSASVSAIPERIFSTFAAEWKVSASARSHPSIWARRAATVDLPLPDTPMTTIARTLVAQAFAERQIPMMTQQLLTNASA